MSNQEFENYLKLVGKLLQLSRSQQAAIAGELRDHLQSRVADLVENGMERHEAMSIAIEEFGDAAVMAKNFQMVSQLKRRRWMMRFATLSLAGMFLVAVLTMAMWPADARFGAPQPGIAQTKSEPAEVSKADRDVSPLPRSLSVSTQRDAVVENALREIATIQYDEVPWCEVEEELEQRYRFNIVLDSSARDDSLTEDEPIRINLHDLPLEKALFIMLKEKNATFIIDNGVLVVISLEDAENTEYMTVKMFDCRELISQLSLARSGPVTDDSDDMGAGMMDMMGGGMSVPFLAAVNSGEAALLLDLVYTMVTPEGWSGRGGLASARIINGVLIVKQSREALSQIETLLTDLQYQINSSGDSSQQVSQLPARQSSLGAPLVTGGLEEEDSDDPFGGPKVSEPGGDGDRTSADPFGN